MMRFLPMRRASSPCPMQLLILCAPVCSRSSLRQAVPSDVKQNRAASGARHNRAAASQVPHEIPGQSVLLHTHAPVLPEQPSASPAHSAHRMRRSALLHSLLNVLPCSCPPSCFQAYVVIAPPWSLWSPPSRPVQMPLPAPHLFFPAPIPRRSIRPRPKGTEYESLWPRSRDSAHRLQPAAGATPGNCAALSAS